MKNQIKRTILLVLLGLAVGAGWALWQIADEMKQTKQIDLQPVATGGAQIGGNFTLVDETGKNVSQANYPGYKLIFFGFTFCPDICPAELEKIAQVMTALPEDLAAQIQPLFVSIDPARDTPEKLKDYTDLFHPKIIGLTGDDQQIAHIAKAYRVYYAKVEDLEDPEFYLMNHSAYVYLVTPDNEVLDIFNFETGSEAITERLKARLQ